MPVQDKTGVPGYEVPPPRPLMAAAGALGLNVAALIAILLDHCDLAAILIILAILLGGFVVSRIMGSPSDKQPVDNHEPPPP